jgi:hypothetical protein
MGSWNLGHAPSVLPKETGDGGLQDVKPIKIEHLGMKCMYSHALQLCAGNSFRAEGFSSCVKDG